MTPAGLLARLLAGAIAAFLLSFLLGPSGFGLPCGDAVTLILSEIRLPRALLGLLAGLTLGITGAALQGHLRNPLAEPGLIGISGGATLGAVIAIHSGLSTAFGLLLPLGGLAGAGLAALLILGLAARTGSTLQLVLAGVAVSTLATALTTLALSLSPNPFAMVEITLWLLGSLEDKSLVHVGLALPFVVAGLALVLSTARGLEALTLGEDAATSLGVDVAAQGRRLVAGVALSVGAITAVSGTIAFVGLIVPHLIRPLTGYRPGRLLIPAGLAGAILVLLADVAVRLVRPYGDLRLGALTALLGAPFFLWLVLRSRGAGR